ncbi:MAG: M48 family metalloprotease [Planctomycetes bacterium]|nr:M48 family metalloprotease [Planctomycetota bacterium]
MNKKHLCTLGLGLLLTLGACASIMNALEEATDENSVIGKVARGANRLRKSFQDLDPSEEHYIGRSVGAQILAMPQYQLADDPALLAYVERVGHGIVALNDGVLRPFLDYRFGVLNTDEINAFACPGGLILVSKGLIKDAKSEDELAAVLAHEIAHVTLRHGVAAIQSANLVSAFQYLGAGAAQAAMSKEDLDKLTDVFGDSIGDVVGTLVTSGYSRDAEEAADQLGRKFLAGAGYDPQALVRMLGHMQGHAGGSGGMFATHPAPQDRIQALGGDLPFTAAADALAARQQRFAAAFTH